MSLLADHPNVHFHYYRPGIGVVRGGDALKISQKTNIWIPAANFTSDEHLATFAC